MDAPIKDNWPALEKMARDAKAWNKLVKRLKEKCTATKATTPATATTATAKRSTRLQQQRQRQLSPLKRKAKKRFRNQHFVKMKKKLQQTLRQTDIREFFKPKAKASAAASATTRKRPPPKPTPKPQPRQNAPARNPSTHLTQRQRVQWARDHYHYHHATTEEFFRDATATPLTTPTVCPEGPRKYRGALKKYVVQIIHSHTLIE